MTTHVTMLPDDVARKWTLAFAFLSVLSAAQAFSSLSAFGGLQLRRYAQWHNVAPLLRKHGVQRYSAMHKLRMPRMSGIAGDGEEEEKNEMEMGGELVGMPPQFFRSDNGTRDEEFTALSTFTGSKKAEKYIQLVASLTPAESVQTFMNTAPPRVQSAMRETILSLFGSLGDSPAFESSVVTTQRALGSLFFQMEMTGYLFRNAEYRKSLERSINLALLEGGDSKPPEQETVVQGNLTLKVGEGSEVNVDAETYVSDLQREVEQLRAEMAAMKEKELKTDEAESIVQYIQQLSAEDMKKMSENISPEVVEAMKHLVKVVMKGIKGPDLPPMLAAAFGGEPVDAVTEMPSGVLAQLCMWQLVVGYNLREIETRDAFNQQLGEELGGDK